MTGLFKDARPFHFPNNNIQRLQSMRKNRWGNEGNRSSHLEHERDVHFHRQMCCMCLLDFPHPLLFLHSCSCLFLWLLVGFREWVAPVRDDSSHFPSFLPEPHQDCFLLLNITDLSQVNLFHTALCDSDPGLCCHPWSQEFYSDRWICNFPPHWLLPILLMWARFNRLLCQGSNWT